MPSTRRKFRGKACRNGGLMENLEIGLEGISGVLLRDMPTFPGSHSRGTDNSVLYIELAPVFREN